MGSTESRLDAVFDEFDSASGPGFVAGVSRPGVPDYRRAGGVMSIESGARNTEHTRMRIGSTTKQFTCFAVMLLTEEGRLRLDDDIRAHLPELPEYPRPVTIRQLMTNTSGLRCYLDLIGILAGFDRAVSGERARRLQLRQRSVNFRAGERLVYCNGGYLLLSLLIERVSGMRLGEFFATRIFEPLGMTRTTFEPDDSKLRSGAATLHQRHPDGSYHRGAIGLPLAGDGAIESTAEDLLRWLRHMEAPVAGLPTTWETMLAAGSDADHGYGFGLMHNTYRGVPIVEHGGTVFGGRCQALRVPEYGISLAIMSNASDVFPSQIAERVLDVLLEGRLGPGQVAASAESASAFAGTFYCEETGDVIRVVAKDGRAFLAGESGDIPLYETSNGGLRTNAASLSVVLAGIELRGNNGFRAIDLREGGHRAVLRRIEPQEGVAALDRCCGVYLNADCEGKARVVDGTPPRLLVRSPYGSAAFALEPLSGSAWLANLEDTWFPLRLLVEFRTSDGAAGLSVSSGRTKRLHWRSAGGAASRSE